jgi:hypothetical protein
MNPRTVRPKWWQVYLIVPLLITLFMLDGRLKLSQCGHQIVQLGILVFIYWLVHLWLEANAQALSNPEHRKFHGTVIITRASFHRMADTGGNRSPTLQLPDSEIKGVLSDTFEMDYIDAQSFTVDEVTHELNKE